VGKEYTGGGASIRDKGKEKKGVQFRLGKENKRSSEGRPEGKKDYFLRPKGIQKIESSYGTDSPWKTRLWRKEGGGRQGEGNK